MSYHQVSNFLLGHIDLVGPRPGLPNQKEFARFLEERIMFSQLSLV